MTNLLQNRGTFPSPKACPGRPQTQAPPAKQNAVAVFADSHRASGLVQRNNDLPKTTRGEAASCCFGSVSIDMLSRSSLHRLHSRQYQDGSCDCNCHAKRRECAVGRQQRRQDQKYPEHRYARQPKNSCKRDTTLREEYGGQNGRNER
jgi:hypothetical protein